MVVTAARRVGGRIRRQLPGRAAILVYHRISTPSIDPWQLAVSPAHFDGHLSALDRVGRILPLGRLVAARTLERLGHLSPRFAITFDDGYADNLSTAVPLLERHNAPATVFIATGLLDQPSFWWDDLASWALLSGCPAPALVDAAVTCRVLDDGQGRRLRDTGAGAPTVHAAIYPAVQRLRLDEIRRLLADLAASSGVTPPPPDGRPMTTGEVIELAGHPLISIGIHTVTHPRLTLLEPAATRDEISGSANLLSELLGPAERVLAYPYGDSSSDVARLAGAVGIRHAVTTNARWIGHRQDPRLLPRLHPTDQDGKSFETWLRCWA